MDDKIVKVIFKEGWDTMYNNDLTQGDFGQVLQIEGITLPDGHVEVHFSLTEHNGEAPVYIGAVKDNVITVDIPDFILAKENEYNSSYEAYAWVYVTDGEFGRTIRKIAFTVETRAKPTTNVPESKKDPFLEEVRQVMAKTKEVADSVRTDADNGKFNGDKGDNGKSAYEYAVEGGFEGTEQEFIDSMGKAGQVDLTGYVTKEQHEAELLKAFVKVTTDKAPYHHITDSANIKVVDFGMEGITEQDTTSGKNLFGLKTENVTKNAYGSIIDIDNGIELQYTDIRDCYCELNYSLLPNTTYTISFDMYINSSNTTSTFYALGVYTDDTTWYQPNVVGMIFTNGEITYTFTTPDTESDIHIVLVGTAMNNGATGVTRFTNFMLSLDSDTTYEPFTNGPSPNPDHKQDIKLAGVLNEETGRYEHKCAVRNKNLWDTEYASDVSNWIPSTTQPTYSDLPIYVGKGKIITISCKDTLTTGIQLYTGVVITEDGSINKWIYHKTGKELINRVITVTTKEDYIWIRCSDDAILYSDTFMQYIGNDLQIEIADTETERVKHQGYKFTLTSDRPLTKWDKLVKRDGVWGWSVNSKIYTVTGEEALSQHYKFDNGTVCYKIAVDGVKLVWGDSDGIMFCDKFTFVLGNKIYTQSITGRYNFGSLTNNQIYFASLSTDGIFESADTFREYLKTENPVVVFQTLIEQTFIPLPAEEQTLLHNLETYYGVTNVYNEQGCPISITYCADQELHWNQKLLQIQQAII